MKFSTFYNQCLINIELNISDDSKIYEQLTELYINNSENNKLLMKTIKEYNFQSENRWKRHFINILLKSLLDKNLLWKDLLNEILKLIYWKINEILWNPEIKWEYLEFWVFFRLSPKKEDVNKLEKQFNLKYYLYKYFLRYYFLEKDYYKCCELLKDYFKKYFSNENEYEFRNFILADCDDSWFKIKEISDEFLWYFINHFENFLKLLNKYEIHYNQIESLCTYGSKNLSEEFLKLLFNEYFNIHNYNIGIHIKSDQIEKLAKINNNDSDFLEYIYDKILAWKFQLFRWWQYLLKWTITENNIKKFFWYKWENYIILNLYYLYDKKDKIWQKIYKKYKTIIDNNQKINEQYRALEQKNKLDEEKKIKKNISQAIKKDKENIKNQNKKYPCREIIYLYNDYPNLFSKKEIEFVKREIKLYFINDNTNPRWQEVEVIQQKINSFTIPRFIRDLIICCKHCEKLWINLWHYTNVLIWLIPYLFDSELNIILNQLKKIWVSELWQKDIEWIINIYLNNQYKDLSKFQNTRITDLISKWFINFSELNNQQKESIYQIYKNKLEDNENVQFREKQKFLKSILEIKTFDKKRLYEKYNNISQEFIKYNYYEDYLIKNIDESIIENYEQFFKFNEILIVLYKDKDCIKWRLNQLKWIKTDYIWESWEMRWLSKRDEEIFRSNSKDERFYMCIINVIKYPDYISDIKKILWIAKKFNTKEESYMWRYIYDFCLEYFKKAPEDKKLQEALTINDEIFVKHYMLNIMDEKTKHEYKEIELQKLYFKTKELYEENEEFQAYIIKNQQLEQENQKLISKNGKLLEKNESLEKSLEKYQGLFDKDELEIFLYVEWKIDKFYLEKAHYHLKKYEKLKIRIINFWGADCMPRLFNSLINDWVKWIHIWLLDFDEWWIPVWANKNYAWDILDTSQNDFRNDWKASYFENKLFVNEYKKFKYGFYSYVLLPVPNAYKKQVFVNNYETMTVDKTINNKALKFLNEHAVLNNWVSNPILTIEHLLWEIFEKYCEKYESFWWFEIKKIWKWGKIKILDEIKNNPEKFSESIQENFLPIFEYLQYTYNEFKNNFIS